MKQVPVEIVPLKGFSEHDPSRFNLEEGEEGEDVHIQQLPWSLGYNPAALANERAETGHCPSCGQQLFQLKTRWALLCGSEKQPERIPLTVPLLVDEGKCMVCCAIPKNITEQQSPCSRFTDEDIRSISTIARQLVPGTAKYNGPYNEYGEKHGEGELIWSNGDVFRGHFNNDLREGHGLLVFGVSMNRAAADKGEYLGDWHEDKMHGEGYRRYPNGDVYKGKYHAGKRQGLGCFYYANGDAYWGEWEANYMHGTGRYYYGTGLRFEGTFVRNKRFGVGKVEKDDLSVDVFQFNNDEIVGQGVRWAADRSKAWRIWVAKHSPSKSLENLAEVKFDMRRITMAEADSVLQQIQSTVKSRRNEDMK